VLADVQRKGEAAQQVRLPVRGAVGREGREGREGSEGRGHTVRGRRGTIQGSVERCGKKQHPERGGECGRKVRGAEVTCPSASSRRDKNSLQPVAALRASNAAIAALGVSSCPGIK